jgi:Ca2+-binding RTX toxin-like protein
VLYSSVNVTAGGTGMTIRVGSRLTISDFILPPPALYLTGTDGNDSLQGGDGPDTLDGGAGADTMSGGLANDSYFVDNASDLALENAGEGTDRVYASVSYTLTGGSHIETLSTTDHSGTGAINLTGNGAANTIYGNAGRNVLDGAYGADYLIGFQGDDDYHVDNANDRVFESAAQGYDRVYASASYTLASASSVERLSTWDDAGTAAINLTGNELSQDIVGNAGANILTGGGGDDWFYGGAGNDGYFVDSANDQVFEYAGQGYDTIYMSASFHIDASMDIEVISVVSLGGTDQISLVGTGIAQELWGNMGNNYFDGKGGNDTVYGIGGDDIFAFSTALGSNNIDRIYGFSTSGDRIQLGGDIFTAIGSGTLASSAFTTGSGATSADHRIIYNSSNGALLYDADGSGAGAAVQFATLDAGMALTSNSFEVTSRTSAAGLKISEEGIADWSALDDVPENLGFEVVAQSVFGFGEEADRFQGIAHVGLVQEVIQLPMV